MTWLSHNMLTPGPRDRLMVLAVHPDDETLGAGGLLQRALAVGASVRVVFVTSGDNNPWPQRLIERRWSIRTEDRLRWGHKRELEAIAALETLGLGVAHAVFLGLPDQGVTRLLTRDHGRASARLGAEIEAWGPTHLVVPAPQDVHPDHNGVAVLASLALDDLPSKCLRPQVLTYMVHGEAEPQTPSRWLSLNESELVRKREAILRHVTQVAFGRRRFLGYARRQESFFAMPDGDAFETRHPVTQVTLEADEVRICLRLGPMLRRFGKPVLELLATGAIGVTHARLALDAGNEAAVFDETGTEIGRAQLRRDDGVIELRLPADLFPQIDRLYLKLVRRWGFFDHAGWRFAALRSQPRLRASVVGIIPCYNVADFCEQVVLQAVRHVDRLLVIDDGSTDGTSEVLARLAAAMPERVGLITFAENHGKGVGLMAGFCEALNRFDFDTLVTLDGDGQHPPQEIPRIAAAVAAGADMAIGGRDLGRMPARSKLGNTTVSSLLRWRYPHAPADTQSGLRGFSRAFAGEILRKVSGSRYETELQMLLLALSQQRNIVSVPIPTIYIDNNRSSKFRPVTDSIRILYALLGWELNHSHRFKP